ncbi:guanine nucleotide-binding protein subunit alpha-15 isoform X1 [Sciurus carolinensis]|uniref:guanine nucleotide-binding protein subunit alpha-15 isoform X1 n=1 Tax=Sciurus carolinensis TaxID=30640 RepID=UPI001FB269E8|nr:guanine nucleotide-binding protein subunit alpha-15 isoform X1 [Sciurus carolinensis]
MARSLTWRCCPWCLTEEEKAAARVDQEISRILLEQKKQDRGELKLLLLGPGESGKSTFIKQMRIIHGAGFSEEDRKGFRPLVYQNIFMSMQAMIEAMGRLQIPFSRPESEHHASLVMSQDPYKVTTFEKPCALAVQCLWRDAGVRACYERRREFHLLDSAIYYLSHLERITEEGYVPTAQDVLRSRMPTTGINEYCFSVQKTNLRIVDVGGQKSERKKWIHCFENVMALIYLASLSEYDQCLEENSRENRMKESLALFGTILELPWFRSTSVILFLNKTDVLEEKIPSSHLDTYFPSFQDPRESTCALRLLARGPERVSRWWLASPLVESCWPRSPPQAGAAADRPAAPGARQGWLCSGLKPSVWGLISPGWTRGQGSGQCRAVSSRGRT